MMTIANGAKAEQLAASLLYNAGLDLVGRNYRCKGGEIDIVANDNGTLVFVEVRLRNHPRFGDGLASVDRRKQQRLIHAAAHFLQCHPQWRNCPCRFDVIALQTRQSGTAAPKWVKSAFTL